MSNNIALSLAKSILQSKLDMLEQNKTVGDSHGQEIEYIARIEDDKDGIAKFKVVIWDEMEGRSTKIMSWFNLQTFISSICLVDWEKCNYRMWSITPQKDVDQDLSELLEQFHLQNGFEKK